MNTKELIISIFVCLTILGLGGIVAYVYVESYDKQVKVAAQIEVERAKIDRAADVNAKKIEHEAKLNIEKIRQEEGTKRTKERMDWIPWHSREK